jgi:hypothetical protein
MIALTLEIAATALLLIVAAGVYLFWQATRAPRGFEDWDGFHLDIEPQRRSRDRRRKRAVVPAVAADDSTTPVPIHNGPPAQAAL